MNVRPLLLLVLSLPAPYFLEQHVMSEGTGQMSEGTGQRRGSKKRSTERRRPSAPGRSSQDDDFYVTANMIQTALPAIDYEVLVCDQEVITRSLTKINRIYEESGLTQERANESALAAWKEVRLNSPLRIDQCMNSSSFINFTLTLGRIVFKSTPGEADITINGKALPDKTTHNMLYESGTHTVRYSKDGYETVEKPCTVLERKENDCYAELKPKP